MEFLKQSDEILSVGEFSRRFKMLVKTSVPELWLSGEISNLKTYSSGHTYFTLKDEDAAISAVLFKGNARAVSFPLREGMKIFAYGEISVYEQRGNYQLIVRAALPDGAGSLAERFNALKRKLADEGLFDAERKKQIPTLPKNVAVITSPTGAAIRDFCRILTRRGWRGNVWILPSRVQGAEAAREIVSQIEYAQTHAAPDGSPFDLLVLMRGGGSLEDLWPFNEEIVARAVAACPIPTISAVGHEIDFTLSDFAADLRAETPSAAAEHISSAYIEASSALRETFENIAKRAQFRLASLRAELDAKAGVLRANSPTEKIANYALRLDEMSARLDFSAAQRIHALRSELAEARAHFASVAPLPRLAAMSDRLSAMSKQLEILGVENTLKRGFALATDSDGRAVSAATAKVGETLDVRFSDGSVSATVGSVARR